MEIITWFLNLRTDELIIAFCKGNVILLSLVFVVLRWYVKRTPSTEDDKLIDSLRSVLPMLKRQNGK